MKNIPHVRKLARAQWFRYMDGAYFVTICTKNRVHYFGKINHAEMHLSAIGKFAQDQIHHTAAIRDGDVSIPQYTVMPNHIHMMVVIHRRRDALNASLEPNAERTRNARTNNERTNNGRTQNGRTRCVPTTISPQWRRFGPQSGNLPSVIRGIKSSVTKFANDNHIAFAWQSRYHDHIIRNAYEWDRISRYIKNNPAQWDNDRFRT